MAITIYWYPNCSTCRKATRWLDEAGLSYEKQDLVATPISAEKLAELHERSGLPIQKFFNTSGQSYRGGGFKDRLPTMSLEDKLNALAADGKLVKRPILESDGAVLVGFKADAYAEALS
jgi:arsenate reductase